MSENPCPDCGGSGHMDCGGDEPHTRFSYPCPTCNLPDLFGIVKSQRDELANENTNLKQVIRGLVSGAEYSKILTEAKKPVKYPLTRP